MLALYAGAACTAGLILLLARTLAAWLAAVVAGSALGCAAGILGVSGAKRVRETSPVPERTLGGAREDAESARGTTLLG